MRNEEQPKEAPWLVLLSKKKNPLFQYQSCLKIVIVFFFNKGLQNRLHPADGALALTLYQEAVSDMTGVKLTCFNGEGGTAGCLAHLIHSSDTVFASIRRLG